MLIQVSPVLVALLAAIVPRRAVHRLPRPRAGPRLRRRRPDRPSSSGGRPAATDVLGVLLCLVSAVVYSVSLVLQKPLVARIPAIHVTWLACTIGAVVCLPFAGQLVDEARDAPASTSGGSSTSASSRPRSRSRRTPTRCAHDRQQPRRHDLPGAADHDRDGLVFLGETPPAMAYVGGALALVGVAVARRKPRTVAAGGQPACPGMLRHVSSSRTSSSAWSPPCTSTSWCSRCSSGEAAGRRPSASPRSSPRPSKVLAANQGLYNGFLVAGLVWGLVADRNDVKLFFLACVIVAGVYGAVTVSRRILVVQALPAAARLRARPARQLSSSPRPASSQPRNASRLWVGSPRSLRHSHSLRIEEAKPSSRIVLNDSSAWSAPRRAAGRARRASTAAAAAARRGRCRRAGRRRTRRRTASGCARAATGRPARGSRRACGRRRRGRRGRARRRRAGPAVCSFFSPGSANEKTPSAASSYSMSLSAR